MGGFVGVMVGCGDVELGILGGCFESIVVEDVFGVCTDLEVGTGAMEVETGAGFAGPCGERGKGFGFELGLAELAVADITGDLPGVEHEFFEVGFGSGEVESFEVEIGIGGDVGGEALGEFGEGFLAGEEGETLCGVGGAAGGAVCFEDARSGLIFDDGDALRIEDGDGVFDGEFWFVDDVVAGLLWFEAEGGCADVVGRDLGIEGEAHPVGGIGGEVFTGGFGFDEDGGTIGGMDGELVVFSGEKPGT